MADEKNNKDAPFTIENNVLKGKVIPYTLRTNSTGQFLFDVMKNNANVIGQVDVMTGEEDTFANMLDRAIKCAIWMQKQGVEKGDFIAVSTHNHIDSTIPTLAALFIGAVYSIWNYQMNITMVRHFINVVEPKLIFANKQSAGVALEVAKIGNTNIKVVCFDDYAHTIPFSEVLRDHDLSAVANFRCTEIDDPDETVAILFTSGTTGLPKGAQISHRAWLLLLEDTDNVIWNEKLPLIYGAPNWTTNIMHQLKSIGTCTKKYIVPDFDPKTACEIIQKFKIKRIQVIIGPACRLIRYNRLHDYDVSSLDTFTIVGSVVKEELQAEIKKTLPGAVVVQGYGLTECGGFVTCQSSNDALGSCGIVAPNCEIKFIDIKTGNILGVSQNGELCMKTPTVTTGYYKNPEATKAIIDEEGWLHTGDIGHYNEKGQIFIVDRLKEIIKYRGHQISPTEVEDHLQSHPAVLEVAVVGIPHLTDEEHPVAFVKKVENKEVTAQELMDMVANNFMDHYKLRGGVHFVPDLPRTHSGKISRRELKVIAKTLASS